MKILVTAGPTWVEIDEVRIITNIFTGATGLYLARRFKKKGHSVTILLNPSRIHGAIKIKGLKVTPFHYYGELKKKLTAELKKSRYDVIIHSAAVSDYILQRPFKGKVPSGKKGLTLRLIPTIKLIPIMRMFAPKATLIQCKLEGESQKLYEKAYRSLKENQADYVIAHALPDLKRKYKALIIGKDKQYIPVYSQKSLFTTLYTIVSRIGC